MLINIAALKKDALNVINKEQVEKAKAALISAYRRREAAQQIVRNVDAEIADLEASIEDGSFI